VLGLRLAAAKTKIRKAGCKVGKIRRAGRARHVRASRLRVTAQSPRGGASRPRGTRIDITLGRVRRR
jgi:beta-lactam-binding protein with PASTA domain